MTITSQNYLDSVETETLSQGDGSFNQIWHAMEPPFKGFQMPASDGLPSASPDAAIIIDNGASLLRAGWSFDEAPRISFPPIAARYRDRKLNRTCSFVGYDAYADATTRGQIRNAFEPGSSIVGNWDVMEGLLDSAFIKLAVEGKDGRLDRPVLMTEPLANLGYSRRTMTELLFECYSASSLAYGIDSLFSYKYNRGNNGLIISSSHTSTHLIPVLQSKAIMTNASRLNWGGYQGAEFLLKILRLKYPAFPGKITDYQAERMIHEHCYVSMDYDSELKTYLEWRGLEDRDHIIQYPFTEQVIVEKSEEELARIAERKREGGRRLQEQAAKMRLEKLIRKEQELEYYQKLQERLSNQSKKEVKRLLDEDKFKDEAQLDKLIKELDKSIRKARNKDVGASEPVDEDSEASFPLLDIPDETLDEAGLKQKRHQRLMKANVDARARAKFEKEQEKARLAEQERIDNERRESDIEGWLQERRAARLSLLKKIKERERLKADLGNRKSLASQLRMKTLATLASDAPGRKRRRAGDDDNFGANDDDWGIYRTVATGDQSEDDDEEDFEAGLKNIEAQLLRYDPGFTQSNTMEAQSDWTKSLLHAFYRGPRPFNLESQQEIHQLHLNVERIRVPEIVFQPALAGLDQAGIVEIAADIITQGSLMTHNCNNPLRDIFLTGGNAMFSGFEDRLRKELRSVLPADSQFEIRKADNLLLDAWKGAAEWSRSKEFKQCSVSRIEYFEKGADYVKEHQFGNLNLS